MAVATTAAAAAVASCDDGCDAVKSNELIAGGGAAEWGAGVFVMRPLLQDDCGCG